MDEYASDRLTANSEPLPTPTAPNTTPRVRSEQLLGAGRELVIEHRGAEYRLLRTRNDRLILNK